MRKITSTALVSVFVLTACGKSASKAPMPLSSDANATTNVAAPATNAPVVALPPAQAVEATPVPALPASLSLSSLENTKWLSNCYAFGKDPAAAVYSRKVIVFANGEEQTQVNQYTDATCSTLKGTVKEPWTLGSFVVSGIDAVWNKVEASCVSGCTKTSVVAWTLSTDGKTLSEAGQAKDGSFYISSPIVFAQSPEAVITIPPVVVVEPLPPLTDLGILNTLTGQTWVSTCYQFPKDVVKGVWNQKTLVFNGIRIESGIAQFSDAACTTLVAPAKSPWLLDAIQVLALADSWTQVKAHCASGCTKDTNNAYKLGTTDSKESLSEAGQKSDGTFYLETPVVYFKK